MIPKKNGRVSLQDSGSYIRNQAEPVAVISRNVVIDDTVLQKPLLILGDVSTGKSQFIRNKLMTPVFRQKRKGDAIVTFCAKREMTEGFYHPEQGDILFSYDQTDPAHIWNLFAELYYSPDPDKTLNEITDSLFQKYVSEKDPFFGNAAKVIFKTEVEYMAKEAGRYGMVSTNAEFVRFVRSTPLHDRIDAGGRVIQKGLMTLIRENETFGPLADFLGNGNNITALGEIAEYKAAIDDIFQGGAYERAGTFCLRKALAEGRNIFLVYDFSESTRSTTSFFCMLLDQLLKLSVKENGQRVYFILDECHLIAEGLQYLQNAMSYGRGNGFRIIAACQSIQLLEKSDKASSGPQKLPALFPNVISFFTSDARTREYLGDRFGKQTRTVISPAGKASVLELPVITDADFFRISDPGDAMMCFAGQQPFIYHGHIRPQASACSLRSP